MISVYNSYNAIGTVGSPVTLTDTLGDNTATELCQYMRRLHLDISFVPGANSQYLILELAFSNDEGNAAPTNFYPANVTVAATTEIDVYADSGTGMGTGSGISYIIPGDKTTTNGTAVSISVDVTDISSRWVRIRARDSGTANFGTLFVKLSMHGE